ncbi:extracellular solute-binding protein [Streptomyces sp. NBS 14/10]|uniref:extracellular solute-binding protein n=1 Tax=Streptomyces sp. NBS 14/10 TaxID=1945643 RepID=UPI000B7E8962|nr:extracellular solute-binding protein [Streptomyces sp. NBS 14/10]KAK1178658.1 extracellular solute-binding protein [Streptomyces sp. NBS 14/10]NUP45412.1 extracellular solute-binding protein [Streptomyces sp.]NUS81256.1 extracellular solute-binding protein [Streptomyces sp.]
MRRGIAATALVAAMALAATACGGDDGGSGGGNKSAGEISGTVTYWDTSNEAEKGTYKKLAEDFSKKYPKVKVNYVSVPFGDALKNFKNAAGSGGSGAPDVLRTEVAWTQDLANIGYLAPLDGTAALDKESDYLPKAAAGTKFKGKTYAVPQVIDTLGLFYNKKLLKEAGVEPPTSWTELKAAAKKIKQKTGKTGLYLRGDDAYFYLPFIYGEGGDLLDTDAKKITVDEEPGVRAFATARDLVKSGAAITDATDGWDNMQNAIKNGDVAMTINGPWAIEDTLAGKAFKDDKSNLGVVPVPAGSKAQGAPQGGQNLTVYAGSKNLDASYAFVKYMSSAEVQAKTTEKLSLLPTRTSVYANKAVAANANVKFFKAAVDKAVERPWIPEGNSLFQAILVEFPNVVTGRTSPEKAAESVAAAYRKLLKGDWK